MLTIHLPHDDCRELCYTLEVLLGEFLGLRYHLSYGGGKENCLCLTLSNSRRLCFEDHFFRHYPRPLDYLAEDNIPRHISFLKKKDCPFLPKEDLPIIFGQGTFRMEAQEILCGADLFASAFFMLSRWEECACKSRDVHGRFPAAATLAFRHGFLHRPLVNEYVELLWNLLKHLGIDQERKSWHFEAVVTHDVDYPLIWHGAFSLLKKLGGCLLLRGNPAHALYYLHNYRQVRRGLAQDPFDTFERLMTMSEEQGLRSHFFFLCGGTHPDDNPRSFPVDFYRTLLPEVRRRGHHIGLHPSYESPEKPELLFSEKQRLEALAGFTVSTGRQHFLRFSVPATWQQWEDAGMEWDSSLYFAEQPGFRAGVCYPYSVFNVLSRSKLKLKELPLSAMEVSWLSYRKAGPAQMQQEVLGMVNLIREYRGTFVLLWHNSMFIPEWEAYEGVYREVLQSLGRRE